MHFRFQPADENAFPPTEVRLRDLHAELLPDGLRIRIYITLTPFQSPPNLFASILNPEGEVISGSHIVEAIQDKIVFTMHIRNRYPSQRLKLAVSVRYPEIGEVDQGSIPLEIDTGA